MSFLGICDILDGEPSIRFHCSSLFLKEAWTLDFCTRESKYVLLAQTKEKAMQGTSMLNLRTEPHRVSRFTRACQSAQHLAAHSFRPWPHGPRAEWCAGLRLELFETETCSWGLMRGPALILRLNR
jgi:hypothetical protein